MSDILEKTEEKIVTTNDGDHDRFQHYFKKADIEANILEGKPMKALCGKIVQQQVDPKGRTVCHRCNEIYEGLK
jgi:phosphomannomutase